MPCREVRRSWCMLATNRWVIVSPLKVVADMKTRHREPRPLLSALLDGFLKAGLASDLTLI